jgi:hypothetical protein
VKHPFHSHCPCKRCTKTFNKEFVKAVKLQKGRTSMEKLVTTTEVEGAGLLALMGERVLLMCTNYFYTGKLTGVNTDFVELEDPAIVYETGQWSNKNYTDEQRLHAKVFYVRTPAIEAFGVSK